MTISRTFWIVLLALLIAILIGLVAGATGAADVLAVHPCAGSGLT